MQNDTLLRAFMREPTPYTPVWIMRQAGRYLPEYNETRRRAGSFLALAKTPELACEVTLQPLNRFALDAAIIFSDILTVPDAMGLGLYFVEGEGPKFERPLRDEDAIAALAEPDMESLRYVFDAIALTRRELHGRVPLIGFSGSPFTLACYMVEGGGNEGRAVPVVLFTKGGGQWLEAMAASGADALGIDWQTDLASARKRVGDRVALQGNLDPMALFAPPAVIQREVERVLSAYGPGPGHVFNLGHGVSQHTPPEHVHALVEAVHAGSLGAHAR